MTQPPMKAREEPAVQFRVALKAPPALIAHRTVRSAFRPTNAAHLAARTLRAEGARGSQVLRANEGDFSPAPASNISMPLKGCLQVWFLKNKSIG